MQSKLESFLCHTLDASGEDILRITSDIFDEYERGYINDCSDLAEILTGLYELYGCEQFLEYYFIDRLYVEVFI
jgi:hypothetical protein